MMNKIKKCFVLSLMASFMFSCTDIETIDLEKEAVKDLYENRDKDKWAEEDAQKQQNYEDSVRIAEENKRLYELYLADLREYKETKHPVMFGWFNAWSAETPGEYSNLTLIPDSMDIVSIWGNCFNINEKRLKQMREVQSKGTKVIVGWIVENVGNGLSNIPEGGWSDDPTTGIKQYKPFWTPSPSMDKTASILTMNLPMPLLSNQAITVATGQTTGQTTGLSSLAARMTIKNMKIFSFKHYAMVWTN